MSSFVVIDFQDDFRSVQQIACANEHRENANTATAAPIRQTIKTRRTV
jgi:hypothetical protein